MKLYVVWSKKKIILATAFFVLCAIILGEYYTALATQYKNAQSNQLRLEYISSLGYEAEETCASHSSFVIPESFSDVYMNYNALQQRAGFDLSDYHGCAVERYTYMLKDSANVAVNLIVYNGTVIGGDISSSELDGFMNPLSPSE